MNARFPPWSREHDKARRLEDDVVALLGTMAATGLAMFGTILLAKTSPDPGGLTALATWTGIAALVGLGGVALVRFVVFPVIVATGLAMWHLPRLRRWLKLRAVRFGQPVTGPR